MTAQKELLDKIALLNSNANLLVDKIGALCYHTYHARPNKATKAANEVYDLLDKMGLTSASALGIALRWENE